jgi:hypothetical protein
MADGNGLEWPATGERFVGRENVVPVNRDYPEVGPASAFRGAIGPPAGEQSGARSAPHGFSRHDGPMAERDKGTDVDKLLAEVDGMLTGGGATPARSVQPHGAPERAGGFAGQLRVAAASGALAAVVVWFAFAILPFLRANSGAIGAFLAAFLAVLVFRRRR